MAFATDCVRPPHATLLPPCPLMPAPGVGPRTPRASGWPALDAAGSHRSARTGRVAGDGQPARLEVLGGRLLGVVFQFLGVALRRPLQRRRRTTEELDRITMDGTMQGNLRTHRASAYDANRFKGSWGHWV